MTTTHKLLLLLAFTPGLLYAGMLAMTWWVTRKKKPTLDVPTCCPLCHDTGAVDGDTTPPVVKCPEHGES